MRKSTTDLFWSKVRMLGAAPGECWTWDGALNGSGYGNVHFRGRIMRAHRVAYELTVGPIPGGLTLDHLCRNPPCVNPAHLEPVTMAENLRRAAAAVTHCPAGHPYDDTNTRIVTGGYRQCRTCDRERQRSIRGYQGNPPNAMKSECIRGHAFTPENTRIQPGGARVCRTCVREMMRARRAGA